MMDIQLWTDEFLDSKRLLGDPEADGFIAEVFANAAKKEVLQLWLKNASGNENLTALKFKFPGISFIEGADTLPHWADRALMKTGAIFFCRHSELIMSLLGLLSLPYCYNAANGAMVLYLSEKIRRETTKRLYDTAVFVWEMMAPNAFTPDGKAFTELLRVRLTHAAVRYYTLKSCKWDSNWGLPVNQEDMAGTNLSFSLIVIRGLRLLGINVSESDQQGFLHLWNVVGYRTGLNEELIARHPKAAQQLDRAISRRQFHSSDHGKELTQALTAHILAVNKSKAGADDILGLMRYLLGQEVAEQLGIQAPDLPAYKIAMIKMMNLLKSFKPNGDPVQTYNEAYRSFRSQRPV